MWQHARPQPRGRHRIAFAQNQIKIPRSEDYPRGKYLQAFEEILRRLAQWLEVG
jgi:hypothetical protein